MPQPTLIDIRQDEILTGEAVALDVQPVGYFLRAFGAGIDVLVSVVILLGFVLAADALSGVVEIPESALTIVLIVTLVTVTVVIPTTVETASRGRSLGKLAVGGRIVRADGGAIGFRHAFIRALVGVLEIYLTLGALALLVAAFTPRAERLGDLLAGTYSERTRAAKLPPEAPGVPAGMEDWAAIADVGRLPTRLARRLSQFSREAATMHADARTRIATELAAEASAHVSPVPEVHPEVLLRAVAAVRRERELRALQLESERVASLTAGDETRRGLPAR